MLTIIGTAMAFIAARGHPISQEMTDAIIASTTAWIPHDPETNPFRNLTTEQLLLLASVPVPPPISPIETEEIPESNYVGLPTNFDPRTDATWKNCIHPVRTQGDLCGSNWALSSTGVLSDRFCVKGKDVLLSVQDQLSCDYNNYGCYGGYINLSW